MTPAPPPDFSGHTALVTGATQNLGYTLALHFARARARTLVHGRTDAEAGETMDRIKAEVPTAEVHAVHFELEATAEIDVAFAALDSRGLAPDILVNNAAHLGLASDTSFIGQTPEFFREVMEVNLFGALRCSQLVAIRLREHKRGGSIINITSLSGERAIWGRSAYCTSKAALEGLTRSMALELARHDIQVNCISAGYIWTPRWEGLTPEQIARRRANTPGGEPTRQDEIARLALFLASKQAPTLIGSRIVIDGGLNAQQVPGDMAV